MATSEANEMAMWVKQLFPRQMASGGSANMDAIGEWIAGFPQLPSIAGKTLTPLQKTVLAVASQYMPQDDDHTEILLCMARDMAFYDKEAK